MNSCEQALPIEVVQQRLQTGNVHDGHKVVGLVSPGGMGCAINAGELFVAQEAGWFEPITDGTEIVAVFDVLAGESGGGFNAAAALARQTPGLKRVLTEELSDSHFIDLRRRLRGGPLVMPSVLRELVGSSLNIQAANSHPTELLTGATRLTDFTHQTFSTADGTLTTKNTLDVLMHGGTLPTGRPSVDADGHFWGDSELSNVFLDTVLRLTNATHVIVFANRPVDSAPSRNRLDPLIHGKISRWTARGHGEGLHAGIQAYKERQKQMATTRARLAAGEAPTDTIVQYITPAPMENGVKLARAGTTNKRRLLESHSKGVDGAAAAITNPTSAPVMRLRKPDRAQADTAVAA